MSVFGGGQGQIRYALIVDDVQANQKIGTFKQNMMGLDAVSKQVTTTFKAGLAPAMLQSGNALANNTKMVQQQTLAHKTLGAQLKTQFTNFSNLSIGLSATATSSLQLAAGFRDYNDAQIAVERVTRKLSLAHEALNKAQDKLNALQAKGITSGKDFAQAQLDVNQATQQVDIQTQLLGESQERLFDSQSQFVVSIVPTVLGAIGSLGAAWKEFGGSATAIATKLTGSFGSLGNFFNSTAGKLTIVGGGIAAVTAVVSSWIAENQRIQTLHAVFDAHVRDWGKLRDTIQQTISQIEADPIALTIKTITGSIGDLKKELTLATNLADVGPIVDKILFGPELQAVSPTTRAMVQKRLQYVKDALANPDNFKDADFTTKSLNLIQAALTDVIGIVHRSGAEWKSTNDIMAKAIDNARKGVSGLSNDMADTIIISKTFQEEIAGTSAVVELELNQNLVNGSQNLDKIRAAFQQTTSKGLVPYTAAWIKQNQNEKIWSDNQPHVQEDLKKNIGLLTNWSAEAEKVSQGLGDMGAADANVQQMIKDDVRFIDQVDKNLNQEAISLGNAQKAWEDFGSSATSAIDKAFGVDPQSKVDKMLKKFAKGASKDIKFFVKTEADEQSVKDTVTNIVRFFEGFMTDDKHADEIGKQLVKNINAQFKDKKKPQDAKDIIAYINWAISQPNTKDLLEKLGSDVKNGQPIPVPTTLDAVAIDTSGLGGTSAELEGTGGGGNSIGLTKAGKKVSKKAASKKSLVAIPATAVIQDVVMGATSAEIEGGNGKDNKKGNNAIKITVDNTAAIKAVDVVAKRIASLSTIEAMISLLNSKAVKVVDVVANRIDSLTNIEPQISLKNNKAFKVIDAVAKRIMGLENLDPTIHVKFSGSGHISGAASGSIKIAQHGMSEILTENTLIYAHKGEKVLIGRSNGDSTSAETVSNNASPTIVEIHNHYDTVEQVRRLKMKMGAGRSKFGA